MLPLLLINVSVCFMYYRSKSKDWKYVLANSFYNSRNKNRITYVQQSIKNKCTKVTHMQIKSGRETIHYVLLKRTARIPNADYV